MSNNKVALEISDPKLEKLLLRSLIWAGSRLFFEKSCHCQKEVSYLITDCKDREPGDLSTIYLVDGLDEESLDEEPYAIYKFSGGKELLCKISYIISDEGSLPDISNCETLSFTALAGGSGTTTIAISVGIMLQRYYDKKVLYVPIMPVNASRYFGVAVENSRNNVYDKVLYELFERRMPHIQLVLQEFENISVFSPPFYNYRWDEFDEKLKLGLECAATNLGYDVIIYDCGNHISKNTLDFVARTTRNYLVVKDVEAGKNLSSEDEIFSERIHINNFVPTDDYKEEAGLYDISSHDLQSLKALDEEFGLEIMEIVKGICNDDGNFISTEEQNKIDS